MTSSQSTVAMTRDHEGENYRVVLQRLHAELCPQTYLEIGTRSGDTLSLSKSKSIAVDPAFTLSSGELVAQMPMTLFYRMTSDKFFSTVNPAAVLGGHIELAFLDGMHRSEFLLRDFANTEAHCRPNSIIAMHDCLPVEIPMTNRVEGNFTPISPTHAGWWTGDVWKTALLLKRTRPNLAIIALDAPPTGLVLVTNLDPTSRWLDNYNLLVEEMRSYNLEELSIAKLYDELRVESTRGLIDSEQITSRFWL